MERWREEAMYVDFTEVTRLREQAYYTGLTRAESKPLRDRADTIERRWTGSPNWGEWIYLDELYDDAGNRDTADDMRRYLEQVRRGEEFDHELNLRTIQHALTLSDGRHSRITALAEQPQRSTPRAIQRERWPGMESEHEEAMRSDFREQAALQQRTYQAGVTESEIGECFSKAREIHGRWNDGPHADQWQYLTGAYEDFRDRPDTMDRFLDNVEHNWAQGWDGGLDDVQRRSLHQAKALTEPQRVRPQRER